MKLQHEQVCLFRAREGCPASNMAEIDESLAIFYSFPTISGSFGGLIAYGIEKHLSFEKTGRYPWSWLFIIEGVMAVGIGLIVIVALPHLPDDLQKRGKKHWLFTEEEIDLAATRFACKRSPTRNQVSQLMVVKHITRLTKRSNQSNSWNYSRIPNHTSSLCRKAQQY